MRPTSGVVWARVCPRVRVGTMCTSGPVRVSVSCSVVTTRTYVRVCVGVYVQSRRGVATCDIKVRILRLSRVGERKEGRAGK